MLSRAKNVKNVNYYIYAKHIYSLDGSVGYYTETQQQPFGQRWVLDLAAIYDKSPPYSYFVSRNYVDRHGKTSICSVSSDS